MRRGARGRGGNHDFFNRNSIHSASTSQDKSSPRPSSPKAQPKSSFKVLTRPKDESQPLITVVPRPASTPEPETEEAPRHKYKFPVPSNQKQIKQHQTNQELKPKKSNVDTDARKLISDSMTFEESIAELLIENPHFAVTAAIGPQNVGKSTILSMLAGNSPHDKYRHYAFRPSSREAVENSRYQTFKIYIFVSKYRGIFLDCQPTNSASIFEDLSKNSRKNEDKLDPTAHSETHQLIAFLLQVSHTLLVCNDYTVDFDLVKIVRAAEMLKVNLNNINGLGIPPLNFNRKTNIVFVHTRANAVDFSYEIKRERIQQIRALFADSLRLRISDNDDLVLMMLAILKPRKDATTQVYLHNTKENEFEAQEIESFEEGIRKMKFALIGMKRDPFSEQPFNEKQWLAYAKAIWKDPSFTSAVESYCNSILMLEGLF